MTTETLTQLEQHDLFLSRHIGPDSEQRQDMLNYVGAESLAELTAQIVPESIRINRDLAVGDHVSEAEGIAYIRGIAEKTRFIKATLAWDIQVPKSQRLFSVMCLKIQVGTPLTRHISLR